MLKRSEEGSNVEYEPETGPTEAETALEWKAPAPIWSRRNHLEWIFGTEWPELGWRLQRIKSREDVPNAFRRCLRHGGDSLIQLLALKLEVAEVNEIAKLMPSWDTRRSAIKLKQLRKELTEQGVDLSAVTADVAGRSRRLERIIGASTSYDQREMLADPRYISFSESLDKLKESHTRLLTKHQNDQLFLMRSEAAFAQQQVCF